MENGKRTRKGRAELCECALVIKVRERDDVHSLCRSLTDSHATLSPPCTATLIPWHAACYSPQPYIPARNSFVLSLARRELAQWVKTATSRNAPSGIARLIRVQRRYSAVIGVAHPRTTSPNSSWHAADTSHQMFGIPPS